MPSSLPSHSSTDPQDPYNPADDGAETRETRDQIQPDSPKGSNPEDLRSSLIATPDSRVSPSHTDPVALYERMAALVGLNCHLVAMGRGRVPAFPKGFNSRPPREITDESLEMMVDAISGQCRRPILGAHLVLGRRSAAVAGTDAVMTLAFEFEHEALSDDEFLSEWTEAMTDLLPSGLAERLGLDGGEQGWVEVTASGGLRVFFSLCLPDAASRIGEVWCQVRSDLASRHLRRCGRLYAELLDIQAIVAPSQENTTAGVATWRLLHGGPSSMSELTVDELHALAAVIDEVSDTTLEANGADDGRLRRGSDLPARTATIRRIFNSRADTGRTVDLLLGAGWKVLSTASTGEVALVKPGSSSTRAHAHAGGHHRPKGSVMVWTTDGPTADGFWTAFDLLSELNHGGSQVGCAETLVKTGAVRLRPRVLAAKHRRQVLPDDTPTSELTSQIAAAIVAADHPVLPNVPLVVMHTAVDTGGVDRPVCPISLAPDGSVHRWTDTQALVLAVVQPAARKGENGIRYLHHVETSISSAVKATLLTDSSLPTARYVADRPVLTHAGAIVSEPGWHQADQALVVIPYRDRQRWTEGYRVPTQPTAGEAQTAADYLLDEVLVDFPCDTDGDRARALVCLISHVARSLTPTQPAFLLDAADRGSGKSLLAEVSRLIASGSTRALSIRCGRRDDEETVKQAVAGALVGLGHLHVDELARDESISSTFLQEVVTSAGGIEKRILRGNQLTTLPPLTLTIAGNNAKVGADWTRRIVPIRLIHRGAGLAHARSGFRHGCLLDWVGSHRPELLAAIHTILVRSIQQRHHPVAGFGSFEGWSALVLGGLSEITIGGVAASELASEGRDGWTADHDELGEQWGEFFAWWTDTFGDKWVDAGEVRKTTTGARPGPALPDVLGAFALENDSGANRRWGKALGSIAETSITLQDEIYRLAKQTRLKRGNVYSMRVLAGSTPQPSDHTDVNDTSAPEVSEQERQPKRSSASQPPPPAPGAVSQPPSDPSTWATI